MPIWRAARSTTSSALRFRRCCGASCRAPARPAGCSRWHCGWFATANWTSRNSSARNTGRCWQRWRRRARKPLKPVSSAPTVKSCSVSTSVRGPKRKHSNKPSRPRPSASPRSKRSRSNGIRSRLSPPQRCNRKQAASSVSRPHTPCVSRNGSMRASISAARPSALSPICAPTACRLPPRRSPQLAA